MNDHHCMQIMTIVSELLAVAEIFTKTCRHVLQGSNLAFPDLTTHFMSFQRVTPRPELLM